MHYNYDFVPPFFSILVIHCSEQDKQSDCVQKCNYFCKNAYDDDPCFIKKMGYDRGGCFCDLCKNYTGKMK